MSIGDLEQEQRAAAGRVAAVQKQLGALAKDDPARGLLKTELEAGLGVPRVARRAPPASTHSAWSFVANVLRNFAGIGRRCTKRASRGYPPMSSRSSRPALPT